MATPCHTPKIVGLAEAREARNRVGVKRTSEGGRADSFQGLIHLKEDYCNQIPFEVG
jgi:hypothetical protein